MSPCPLCRLSFFFGVFAGAAIMLIGSIGIRERERRERERMRQSCIARHPGEKKEGNANQKIGPKYLEASEQLSGVLVGESSHNLGVVGASGGKLPG